MIEVGVGSLFVRQHDITSHRAAACFFGSPVGGFHEARTSPGHYRKAHLAQTSPHLTGQGVVGMIFLKPSGAKDTDTGADKMEGAKAGDKLSGNAKHAPQFP